MRAGLAGSIERTGRFQASPILEILVLTLFATGRIVAFQLSANVLIGHNQVIHSAPRIACSNQRSSQFESSGSHF